MSRGREITEIAPAGMSTAKVARSAGRSRKMEIRSLIVSSEVVEVAAGAAVAALCSAFGTAENACWTVLCTLPAAVPVA